MTSCNDDEVRGSEGCTKRILEPSSGITTIYLQYPVDVTIVQIFISSIFQRTRQLSMIKSDFGNMLDKFSKFQ